MKDGETDVNKAVDQVSSISWSADLKGEQLATVSVSVKDAGDYDVYIVEAGKTAEHFADFSIAPADFSNCEFELTSGTYAKGETPEISKITLDGVDVTADFEGQMPNLSFYTSNTGAGDTVVTDITKAAAGTYYAFLNTSSLSGNFTVSGNVYLACRPEFKLTDATAPEVAFANGKAVAGVDQDGKAVEADEKGAFSVVSDKENALYVIPTSIIPEGGKEVAVEPVDAKNLANSIYADTNEDGKFSAGDQKVTALSDLKDAGKYFVAVQAKDQKGVYAGAVCYVPLTVKAFAFDSVTIFDKDADNNGTPDAEVDIDNTEFVYDGYSYEKFMGNLGFAVDGTEATAANLKLFNSIGQEIDWNSADKNVVMPAGSYTVTATIEGTPVEATFTVEKLDLSKAVVVAGDVEFKDNANTAYKDAIAGTTVNGKHLGDGSADVANIDGLVFSVSPITKVGAYKATLSATAGQQNVTGTATVDFNVVKDLKSETFNQSGLVQTNYLTYGKDTVWGDQSSDLQFAVSGSGSFDKNLVGVVDALEDEDYTVSVLDKDGNEVSGDLKANEVYTVVVRIVPSSGFEVGGTFTRTITVSDGSLANCDVTVTYKGDVVEGISADYTGKNVVDDVAVAVKDGKKTLTEGDEYELVLKDAKGEVVDEAVESGLYTLEVRGLTYSGSVSIPVAVGDMQVTALRVQPSDMGVVAWTGEAVTPVIEYTLDSQAKIDAGTAEWTVLPADFYVAKYFDKDMKAIDGAVDEGTYYVTVSPSTKVENMQFKAETKEFTVSKTVAGFVDVSTSEWYANVVAKANKLGYMTGISGTAMFAPNATITRAEVAEVFAKMAGLQLDKDKTYPTKFSDVPSDAWFAQSVAWASQAGIVGGYDGTDLFGSFDEATREQVATMIYRYAAVAGLDTSVEDEAAALASYKDASQLTFGKTAMAWCVENGIMGVDTDSLNPLANMSRAEMAATAVRVQPEKLA